MANEIDDHIWMRRALALAVRGQGSVEPNPMVGAVVLDAAGQLVEEGCHVKFGGPHAEVVALAAAGEKARGGTLYVTLEPCCHFGKTPPCTDAIKAAAIRRVVAAMADPFPQVAGGGVKVLRDAGIDLTVGVAAAEARELNAPYLKRLATGKPWVHLKWAMSLDGKIATRTGDSKWISSEESRRIVHDLRGRMDAIIVGGGTVRADDPLLTARTPGPRVATRVVLSASGNLPADCQLVRTAREVPVLVVSSPKGATKLAAWERAGAEFWLSEPRPEGSGLRVQSLPSGHGSIPELLVELGRRGMTNVLVEGGAGVHGEFVDAGDVDEVHVFVAPLLLGVSGPGPLGGSGFDLVADGFRIGPMTWTPVGGDIYGHGRVMKPVNSSTSG
jgi:diaminohydroxyphosphoribosylaminopyrimidine deaminase/5-amino-6-(5-phosphoribosylamino)uracil reductase